MVRRRRIPHFCVRSAILPRKRLPPPSTAMLLSSRLPRDPNSVCYPKTVCGFATRQFPVRTGRSRETHNLHVPDHVTLVHGESEAATRCHKSLLIQVSLACTSGRHWKCSKLNEHREGCERASQNLLHKGGQTTGFEFEFACSCPITLSSGTRLNTGLCTRRSCYFIVVVCLLVRT